MALVQVHEFFRNLVVEDAQSHILPQTVTNRQGLCINYLQLHWLVVWPFAFQVVEQQALQIKQSSLIVHFEILTLFKGNLIFPGILAPVLNLGLKGFWF